MQEGEYLMAIHCPECRFGIMKPANKPGREWDEDWLKCQSCGYECDIHTAKDEDDDNDGE